MYDIKQSLFGNIELVKVMILNQYKIATSLEFLNCADEQLTDLFIKATGLKPNKNLSISIPINLGHSQLLDVGSVSKLKVNLYVNHNWNPIEILWVSKSGRIYKIDETNIDCNDIHFYYSRLEVDLYLKQYLPKGQMLPFSTEKLPFTLEVSRLNVDCILSITIKRGFETVLESFISDVYGFIEVFNSTSEKKARDEGVIHNIKGQIIGKNEIAFDIDLGSVGVTFLKKILIFLSEQEGVEKVIIS